MNSQLQELQVTLDRATEDAQYWDLALKIVVDILGATGALIPATDPFFRGTWMAGTKEMKEAIPAYINDGWVGNDPREAVLKLMMERGYASDHDVFPNRAVKDKIPIFRDYLYPLNFGVCYCIRILTPNGYWAMTVHFNNDQPPVSAVDALLIKRIQAMFAKATAQAYEIAHIRIAAFAQFFKGTASEVFVLDVDGKECFSINNGGKIQTRARLSDLIPDEMSVALGSEIRELCSSDPNLSMSRAYQFNIGDKSSSVLIIQIPPNLRHFFMHFKACAIRTQCSDISAFKQTRLRETYGLSPAEITTVDLLVGGKTPNMIADLLSVKATTVRQRLKQIYEKTQVNSQVELIGLHNRL